MKPIIIQSDLDSLSEICSNPGKFIDHFKLISRLGSPFYWQQWDYDSGFLYSRLHNEPVQENDALDHYRYWQLWDNQPPVEITDSEEVVNPIPGANNDNTVGVREFVNIKHFIDTFSGSQTETEEDIKDTLNNLYSNPEIVHPHAPTIDEIADSIDDD